MTPSPSPQSTPTLAPERVRELASGVDALYLSGKVKLSPLLFEVLEELRERAATMDEPQPLSLAGSEFFVEGFGFGKYRYRLTHPAGLVGVTTSEHLPAIRVQVRAEYLHGAGPLPTLSFFDGVGEYLAGGPVPWSLSRLDLFCDVQGWSLVGDDRDLFVCRADRRDLHEHGGAFGGLEFGRRSTKTVCARIYDKTRQVDDKGIDWWPVIWGDRYDRTQPVLRVEAEIGRQGLVEYGVDTPLEGLEQAGSMWANVTESWLTYRSATADATRARWPIAPEWTSVQRASLRSNAIGVDRVRALRRKGELRKLLPALVGYSARAAALVGTDDIDTTLSALGELFRRDEQNRGVMFADRIAERAAEEARR